MNNKYSATECRCWCNYPNPTQKREDGSWKCTDSYELVKNRTSRYRSGKTRCRLKKGMNKDGLV